MTFLLSNESNFEYHLSIEDILLNQSFSISQSSKPIFTDDSWQTNKSGHRLIIPELPEVFNIDFYNKIL